MFGEFSTRQASELTGASVRQIDYWDRSELLKPSGVPAAGKGSKRRFCFRDLVALRTICTLRDGNCPLQKIRKAIRFLQSHYPDEPGGQSVARLTLMTDGNRVYMLADEQHVMEVVTQQQVWSVPLGKLILETSQMVNSLPQKWTQEIRVAERLFHLVVSRENEGNQFIAECRELPGVLQRADVAAEAVDKGRQAIVDVAARLEMRNRQTIGRRRIAAT